MYGITNCGSCPYYCMNLGYCDELLRGEIPQLLLTIEKNQVGPCRLNQRTRTNCRDLLWRAPLLSSWGWNTPITLKHVSTMLIMIRVIIILTHFKKIINSNILRNLNRRHATIVLLLAFLLFDFLPVLLVGSTS